MKATNNTIPFLLACVSALTLIGALFISQHPAPAFGSVTMGSEYHGTTTSPIGFAPESLVQTGSGVLGHIVLTGTSTGYINVYDATTSNINLRTGQVPTSTILIANIPISAQANTYAFDRIFYNGLYVSVVGQMPTTTITFR